MSLLECREKGLCIHLGPHHVLVHEEDVIKKVIMSDPMFQKLPKSLRFVGLSCQARNLVLPSQRRCNMLNKFFLFWLHIPFPFAALTILGKTGDQSDSFRKAALRFLVLGVQEAAVTSVCTNYDSIVHPLYAQLDRPAPLKQMQLKLAMAFDQGRPTPECAKGILKLLSTPLLAVWLSSPDHFQLEGVRPDAMKLLQMLLAQSKIMNDLYPIPDEDSSEFVNCPLTHWVRRQLFHTDIYDGF